MANRLVALLVLASLCACAKAPLENIPLVWKPTSKTSIGTINLTEVGDTRIRLDDFRDTRKTPELIAENREEAVPKPVTTRDNVGQFVSAHMRQILQTAGLDIVDGDADVVISGEVRQFFVEETSTYNGSVLLRVAVHKRNGATLWNGTASGSAKTFGRSYSSENYYEVLSDSVVDATGTLLRDPDFRHALSRR